MLRAYYANHHSDVKELNKIVLLAMNIMHHGASIPNFKYNEELLLGKKIK